MAWALRRLLQALALGGCLTVSATAAGAGDAGGAGVLQTADAAGASGRSVTVDAQVDHPNGTQLFVREAFIYDEYVELDIKVINGAREAVELNSNGNTVLVDQGGRLYRLMAPTQNRGLRINEGAVMEGKLVFIGHVSPDLQRLELQTNPKTGSPTSDRTRRPRMTVAIPLDEAKKND